MKWLHSIGMKGRFPAACLSSIAALCLIPNHLATAAPGQVKEDRQPLVRTGDLTTSYANVVKKASPSVVNVFSTKKVQNPFQNLPDPLREFFGDRFGGRGEEGPTRRQQGLGSGVIIREDGYILTNNHVIEGAEEIKVLLTSSTREYAAELVGSDPRTDLAVLKIEATDLTPATLADSDEIEVGDLAFAIGNPFGVGQTVTMGIVSATGRGGMGIGYYEDFIQTDAAINPGNSGGALVDAQGRLMGINTAILSRTGGNQGVGFAVPIGLARYVMDQIIEKGRVDRGYLGVRIQPLTPDLAEALGAEVDHGAVVAEVTEDSAAEEAGIKSGDIIISFNGQRVDDSRSLQLQVGRTSPNSTAKVTILRDGEEKTFNVKLKQLPDQPEFGSRERAPSQAEDEGALQGVQVADISSAARQQLNIPSGIEGALILSVDPASAAFEAGLRQGQVILEINRRKVENAEDAVEQSRNIGDRQRVLVRLWERGGIRYIVVDERDD